MPTPSTPNRRPTVSNTTTSSTRVTSSLEALLRSGITDASTLMPPPIPAVARPTPPRSPDGQHKYRNIGPYTFRTLRAMRSGRTPVRDGDIRNIFGKMLRSGHQTENLDPANLLLAKNKTHDRLRRFFRYVVNLNFCSWLHRSAIQSDSATDVRGDWVSRQGIIDHSMRCATCNGIERRSQSLAYYDHSRICEVCSTNPSMAVWSVSRNFYVAPTDADAANNRQRLNYSPRSRGIFAPIHAPADFWHGPMPKDIPSAPNASIQGNRALLNRYSDSPAANLPSFNFIEGEKLPTNPRWLGIELECEPRLDAKEDFVDRIHAATKDFAILKSDSSLGTGGVEIVSVPATLAWHKKVWKPFLADAHTYLRSWTTNRCGIHVHISRASLTSLQAGRMLVFVNEPGNLPFIASVAGRSQSNYARMSKKRLTDERITREHYDALHTSPRNGGATMELRIFRGNVREAGFFRSLEFTDALCEFCADASNSKLTSGNFLRWLDEPTHRAAYPYLAHWAEKKKMIPERHIRRTELIFEEAA